MTSLTIATYILIGIFALAGSLAIWAAAINADWFFTSANVRALTGRLSRRTARCIYLAIGLAVIAMAVKIYLDMPV